MWHGGLGPRFGTLRSAVAAIATLLGLAQAARADLTRQPYLQSLTPTSVVVAWQTDLSSGSDSLVSFGTTQGNLDQVATATAQVPVSTSTVRQHAVTITGLTPSTRYFYSVGTVSAGVEAGGTSEHHWDTAPPVGSETPATLWVLGDSGSGSSVQRDVRDAILNTLGGSPDLFLHVGDIAYDTGTNAEFSTRHFAIYQDILRNTPFWPAIGNHEASGGASDSGTQSGPYYEAFVLPDNAQAGGVASGSEAYYSFDYANAHIIVLDSDDSETTPGSGQLSWLASDLAALPATTQWLLALFHHPPYSKGSHNSDSASDSGGRMQRMRENVLPLLEAGGVDLVLCGHSHSFERSYLIDGAYGYGTSPNYTTPSYATLLSDGHILDSSSGSGGYDKPAGITPHAGTVYVVTGHGGQSLSGSLSHPVMAAGELFNGSTLVTLDVDTMTVQNVRSSGSISDQFVLNKPSLSAECEQDADCDDADACTTDSCSEGNCEQNAVDCDDADACTTDSCQPATGCAHASVVCAASLDPCFDAACDAALGCIDVANSAACDDGDPCTQSDQCSAGTCSGVELNCDGTCQAGNCVTLLDAAAGVDAASSDAAAPPTDAAVSPDDAGATAAPGSDGQTTTTGRDRPQEPGDDASGAGARGASPNVPLPDAAASDPATRSQASDAAGCSCRIPGRTPVPMPLGLAALFAATLLCRRCPHTSPETR